MARKKSLLVMLRPQLILIGAIILGVGIFALCYNAGGVNMLSDPQFAPADTQPAESPLPDESPAVSDSPQPTETPKRHVGIQKHIRPSCHRSHVLRCQ